MIKIDWKKDYQKEFLCFHCEKCQLVLNGQNKGSTGEHTKRSFVCSNLQCKKSTLNSCDLHPSYLKNLLSGYGFACPNKKCHARQMKLRNEN